MTAKKTRRISKFLVKYEAEIQILKQFFISYRLSKSVVCCACVDPAVSVVDVDEVQFVTLDDVATIRHPLTLDHIKNIF